MINMRYFSAAERAIEQAMLEAAELNRGECDTNFKHLGEICEGLWMLRNDNMMCDMTIKVGEENIRAHRAVLSSCSRYLKTCCTYPMSFNDEGLMMLNVDRYSFKVCLRMLEYIYTGRLFPLPQMLKGEFLKLAGEWQITLPSSYLSAHAIGESDESGSTYMAKQPGAGREENPVSQEDGEVRSELSRVQQEIGESCAHLMAGSSGQTSDQSGSDLKMLKEDNGAVFPDNFPVKEQAKDNCPLNEQEKGGEISDDQAEEDEPDEDTSIISDSESSGDFEEVEPKPELQRVNAQNILNSPELVYPASEAKDLPAGSQNEASGKDGEAGDSEGDIQVSSSSDEQSRDSCSSEVRFSIKTNANQEKRMSPRLRKKTQAVKPGRKAGLKGVTKKKKKKKMSAVAELKLRRQMPSLMNKYKMPFWCDECKLGFTAENLLRGHSYECHWKEGMEMPKVYTCPVRGYRGIVK